METNRPTVARASAGPICGVARIPILASDPLTDMICPKGVVVEFSILYRRLRARFLGNYAHSLLHKSLSCR